MGLIFFLLVWLITGSFWKAALIWVLAALLMSGRGEE